MEEHPNPIARFFGYAMIAFGVLITLLSGACTLVFLTTYLQPHGDPSMIWMPLAFGGPFIAIGIGLVAGGRAMSRCRNLPPPSDETGQS